MPLCSNVAYGKVVNVCMFLNKEVVPVAFDTTITSFGNGHGAVCEAVCTPQHEHHANND